MLRSAICALIVVTSFAHGQVLYETSFDDDSGWVFDPPGDGDSEWRVDGLPASTMLGAFHSAPASLNYNNDFDYAGYGYSYSNGSNAYSPAIDLSLASVTPTLMFWCNNRLDENVCDNHESVTLRIQQGSTLLAKHCLTCGGCYQNAGPISPCNLNSWHQHTIPLDPAWGVIQLVFRFRGDAVANDGPGFFIDDLSVVDVLPTATYCTAKVNSQGCSASIAASGVPNVSGAQFFLLDCTQVLNQKNGLLFYGLSGRHNGAFLGGYLCVKQPVRRATILPSGGNAPPDDCSGRFLFDFNAWVLSGADPALTAGVDVNGQFWYRDPADPHRTGLSNGVEFTLLP